MYFQQYSKWRLFTLSRPQQLCGNWWREAVEAILSLDGNSSGNSNQTPGPRYLTVLDTNNGIS